MNARILLVEDEESIRDAIKLNLELEGYLVDVAGDGKKAIQNTKGKHYDLIILDVMLPEMDGFAVCEAIRLENSQVPILFLTAKGSGEDRIMGLKKGADDYLPKPFNLEELLLRVNNLIKRNIQSRDPQAVIDEYKIGSNKINFITYQIITDKNEKIPLTKKEILLLKLLIERKGQVVSRETILNRVWGYDVYPTTRTIDNFILKFRKYFEPDPHNPLHFHSVRGVGYKFID
jgi:two-component system, OmpR family, alkaline phosphatase synthesis response regulator PhoP